MSMIVPGIMDSEFYRVEQVEFVENTRCMRNENIDQRISSRMPVFGKYNIRVIFRNESIDDNSNKYRDRPSSCEMTR